MPILNNNYTYIDLFAGIGGFRHAMNGFSNGQAQCLYASEINDAAANIYEHYFHQRPLGDIRQVDPLQLGYPAPDVVCGGFP